MQAILDSVLGWLGIEEETAGHREKLLSGLGGALGIFAILVVSAQVIGGRDLPLIVASMGASAVLLFAAPHGKFSQPWNLIGGHLISASIGVTAARWVPQLPLAAALAVGGAITAMYYARCIHPPGGASALVAVVGGDAIHQLGYQYLLTPVGLDVLVILAVAVLFNLPLHWRRYPVAWAPHRRLAQAPPEGRLRSEDISHALRRLGSYIDVTEEDLETIFTYAAEHRASDHLPPGQIRPGAFYSNGAFGADWSVRQVVDAADSDAEDALVIYKVVAGAGRRTTGTTTRGEFARWARYEVIRNENSWQRVDTPSA